MTRIDLTELELPTSNVHLVDGDRTPIAEPARMPVVVDEGGDWSVVDGGGAPVARADSRRDAVKVMGLLALRDRPALPLRLLGPGAVPTGDRLGCP